MKKKGVQFSRVGIQVYWNGKDYGLPKWDRGFSHASIPSLFTLKMTAPLILERSFKSVWWEMGKIKQHQTIQTKPLQCWGLKEFHMKE